MSESERPRVLRDVEIVDVGMVFGERGGIHFETRVRDRETGWIFNIPSDPAAPVRSVPIGPIIANGSLVFIDETSHMTDEDWERAYRLLRGGDDTPSKKADRLPGQNERRAS